MTFSRFREIRSAIVTDAPLPGETASPMGGPYIVGIVHNDEARRFIVDACNTHDDLVTGTKDVAAAIRDLDEARETYAGLIDDAKAPVERGRAAIVRAATQALFDYSGGGGGCDDTIAGMLADVCAGQAEAVADALFDIPAPEPEPFGWYGGPSETRLCVGPLPTWEAAYHAAHLDYGIPLPIVLVEARPGRGNFRPFGGKSPDMAAVFLMIENLNGVGGIDGVLPPMQRHHRHDLADMLNDAVEAWATKHRIRMVTASLGEVRKKQIIVADEVDVIEVRQVMDDITDAVCSAIDCIPVGPPLNPSPHTGDMAAMLDDVRNGSC